MRCQKPDRLPSDICQELGLDKPPECEKYAEHGVPPDALRAMGAAHTIVFREEQRPRACQTLNTLHDSSDTSGATTLIEELWNQVSTGSGPLCVNSSR